MVESKKALPKEPRGFNYFANPYGQPHPGNGIHGHYLPPTAYPRHIYGYSGGYGNQVRSSVGLCTNLFQPISHLRDGSILYRRSVNMITVTRQNRFFSIFRAHSIRFNRLWECLASVPFKMSHIEAKSLEKWLSYQL